MKKILLQLILFLVTVNTAAAEVIISQVLYDPANTESGGEAVELYNSGQAIDISGWVISTETSLADATIPEGTVIGSNKYYLVADAGWNLNRDDLSWPEADHEEAITLANADAGVALSNTTHFIDAAGWGNALNIDAGLFEGTPHAGAGNGESLRRTSYADTNDNANDFTNATPHFRNSSYGEAPGSEITVIAVVEGSFPVISSFAIITDDDSLLEGNQVNPAPKLNKTVEVSAVVSHSSGNSYINGVELEFLGANYTASATPINSTAANYTAKVNLSYYDAAGNYSLKLYATDNNGFSANATALFEYTSLLAVEVDASTLIFSAMPGMSSEIGGDVDAGSNATLHNIGNSVLDVQLSGTNLSSGSGTIDAGNIQYAFNGDYNNALAGTISATPETKQIGLAAAGKQPLSFRLSIPTATAPGNYTGTISIVAVQP